MNRMGKKSIFKLKENIIYLSFVILLIAFTLLSKLKGINFLSANNLSNIMVQTSIIAIVAIGESLVILTGGIDLVGGSIVGLSGILMGKALLAGVPIWLAAVLGVLSGGVLGAINGVGVSWGKIPAFIMTLGTMEIGRGAALAISGGKSISGFPLELNQFAKSNLLFGIPNYIVIVVLFYVVITIVMSRLRFGRHVFAVGGNKSAARLSGVNTKLVELLVYTISGLLAGFAGFMLLSRMVYASPTAGEGYEMDAIAATVLGGIVLSGGKGKIYNTFIGALIMTILKTGLQVLGVSSYIQNIAIGAIIIIAVFFDKASERTAE